MFSRFFIDRPIFATVLSIAITLAGGLALLASLPIAMYPPIAPPTVNVTCQYPGASAQVVAETVAAPIEQQVNGVENMMYMSSTSANDGNYSLTVTFKHGIDMNLAQVLVQNRVALAMPLLPDVIKATGVTTKKQSPDILMAIGIWSPDSRFDQLYLSNYAQIRLQPELARLPGISEVRMFGQRDYSMRIWLDPDKLAIRNMTAGDVVLRPARAEPPGGRRAARPVADGAGPEDPDHADDAGPPGRHRPVRQHHRQEDARRPDRADPRPGPRRDRRQEPGHRRSKVNGKPVANLAVFQLPDANALETADVVKAKIEELKKDFPEGVDYMIRYDTTPFIRESIQEVFKTLLDSVVLVALVVLVFLQNWRSAIIPLVAVPVGIVGTFAVMLAMGFSLNNLTLFGLVLAIGIVVDDAIVVVEAVEHHIEHGLKPRAATLKAMSEVSAPVIAVGLVLSAVFIPCAFITGITGQFFRQFALTIASSTVISTLNSLTLSPALAAMLLKPKRKGVYDPLPWPAFAIVGAWAGYSWLLPYLREHSARGVASRRRPRGDVRARLRAGEGRGHPAGSGRPAGVALGGGGGLDDGHVAGEPVAGILLRVVQPGLHGHGQRLFPAGRWHAQALRPGPAGLRPVAGRDLLRLCRPAPIRPRRPLPDRPSRPGFRRAAGGRRATRRGQPPGQAGRRLGEAGRPVPRHAPRLHPVAGHGLPAGQHPAPRLGVAGADRRGARPDQQDRARGPGRERHGGDRRPVAAA